MNNDVILTQILDLARESSGRLTRLESLMLDLAKESAAMAVTAKNAEEQAKLAVVRADAAVEMSTSTRNFGRAIAGSFSALAAAFSAYMKFHK